MAINLSQIYKLTYDPTTQQIMFWDEVNDAYEFIHHSVIDAYLSPHYSPDRLQKIKELVFSYQEVTIDPTNSRILIKKPQQGDVVADQMSDVYNGKLDPKGLLLR